MSSTSTRARLAAGAAAAIALCLAAPTASASPVGGDGVAPGISIFQSDPEGGTECTAGFLVVDQGGGVGVLTAGHCADNVIGPVSSADLYGGRAPIGRYLRSIHNSDHDIALVGLNPGVDASSRVAGQVSVVDLAQPWQLAGEHAMALCVMGSQSHYDCGPIERSTVSRVWFRMAARHGDSGSPVFAVRDDGGLTAVGILVGRPEGDDGTTVAELVEPWLRAWGLRLA